MVTTYILLRHYNNQSKVDNPTHAASKKSIRSDSFLREVMNKINTKKKVTITIYLTNSNPNLTRNSNSNKTSDQSSSKHKENFSFII